ncbi:hypothetical protein AB0M28_13545 [Streptomyces sp. NPDC051940]|uniref:hypothetical protein n=1 Tax=Streptomyces sp. NPDC051940 TaxID=3155675 RepID=UPI003428D396
MDAWMAFWRAVWVGSSTISRWLGDRLRQGTWLKVASAAGIALFLNGLHVLDTIAWVLAAVWAAVAIPLGLRTPAPPSYIRPPVHDPLDDETDDEVWERITSRVERQPIHPDDLAAALRTVAAPHAHTAAVATHLGESPDRVRDALRTAGIPTHPVRMRGRGVSTGVRAGDIPPLPDDPTPDPGADVAAGQASNNNINNTGAPFEVVPDAERPYRSIVRWRRK